MRSVEEEYKMTKIKSAIKLYSNEDPTMRLVRAFEENAIHQGHQSLVKEAREFAEELGFTLDLSFPHPKCRDNTDGADVPTDKIKRHLKKAAIEQRKTEVKEKKWQGKLLAARWEEDQLNQWGCFAGMLELYEQLTPTKVYYARKTQTNRPYDTLCRLCGKTAESIPHVLASCSALAQNKYLARHNAALQVLFWEMLRELQLSDTVPPWYSLAVPKPIYESPKAQAYWDIPVFAVSEQGKHNRVDARFIDHEKKVLAAEMSCPWTENREKKQEEKTIKYGPLHWELKQQFPGYDIRHYNIIIDVLGGWSTEVDEAVRELFGARGGEILLRMQRAIIPHTLNIARTLKVMS